MKKHQLFIGVDVSKATLDVAVLVKEEHNILYQQQYENTRLGCIRLLRELKKLCKTDAEQYLFCMEHTGIYTIPLCCQLSEAMVDYVIEPGLQIHRSLGIKRGKSDKADAKDIARYACMHEPELKLYSMPEQILVDLKLLLSHRDKLLKAKRLFSDNEEIRAYCNKSDVKSEVVRQNTAFMKQLDAKIKKADADIDTLIKSDEELSKAYALASSVPGIGRQITCYLLVYTRCFTAFENSRQLASYIGVAPFEFSSGTSIMGRTKVSHLANKKLKSLINMGALTAKKYDQELLLYYKRKEAEGKNRMLIMNAIRNKLVARIFATVKRGTPYVPTMRFAS
jgi:transposase